MRAAVYSGTRNIYEQMLPSMKSLLEHSNVEKIYFLIEDDEFPYELPPEVECINVSNQQWFLPDSPNYKNILSYMVLLRAAYTKLFPHLDRVLTIDYDTVVNENVSDLWDLDLTDYYMAAALEKELTEQEGRYYNMGVAMLNLKKLREDKMDDKLIDALNTYIYRYKEQDCFNDILKGHIYTLPSDYNASKLGYEPQHEKITHFAAIYKLDKFPHFDYYKNLPLSKLKRNIPDRITLDVIIATYNNKKGLRKTLSSIPYNKNVNIIVIDDASGLDYTDVLNEYQFTFYQLETNVGPGMARQYGLEHSNGTYITFLDTGDYFYPGSLDYIMNQINENTYIKMYNYSYVFDDKKILRDMADDKTIGVIYKRSFLEMYNIHFSKEGSYANEDYGFSRACKIILEELEHYKFFPMRKKVIVPAFYEHVDKNSLTKGNNNEFFYIKLPLGIIINGLHAIQIAEKAHVSEQVLAKEYNRILVREYFYYLCITQERPELIQKTLNILVDFYNNHYKKYKKLCEPTLMECFQRQSLPLIKTRMARWENFPSINIRRFINQLENYKGG